MRPFQHLAIDKNQLVINSASVTARSIIGCAEVRSASFVVMRFLWSAHSIYYILILLNRTQPYKLAFIATPSCVGVSTTSTPAALSAATLPSAVPLPPVIIAPACPILFPGGAVRPAI